MESLQHAGWEPSPPSKEIMSPAAIKTCTQLDVCITALGGGRDIFSHRYAPSPTDCRGVRLESDGGVIFCFLLYSPIHKLFFLCFPAQLQSHSLSWHLCFLGWFGTWESLGLFCQIFKLPLLFGGFACRDIQGIEVFKLGELWLVVSP